MTGAGPVDPGQVRTGSIRLPAGTVEVQDVPSPAGGPGGSPLVLLHEGLGSVSVWKDMPAQLAAVTGRRVVTYSRFGYGRSAPVGLPREPHYMHVEAEQVLPAVLAEMGLDEPVLVGHSDGASIALIHAGSGGRVRAVVAVAPHAFVEDCTVEGARSARSAYTTGDLRARLARHHRDVDGAFFGWNDIWLSDAFRSWTIEDRLPRVEVPLLLIQSLDDPYGTIEQLDRIEALVRGPVRRLVLAEGGHAPHHPQRRLVLDAIAGFVAEWG